MSRFWGRPDTPPLENDRELFGQWLGQTRQTLGYSQARLGEVVGLHQSTISRLERGLVRYLRFETVLRLLLVMLDALGRRR